MPCFGLFGSEVFGISAHSVNSDIWWSLSDFTTWESTLGTVLFVTLHFQKCNHALGNSFYFITYVHKFYMVQILSGQIHEEKKNPLHDSS